MKELKVTDRLCRNLLPGHILFIFFLAVALDCKILAAPRIDDLESIFPSIGYDFKVTVNRGESCKLIPRAIVMPRETVEFVVVKQPRHGNLEGPWPLDPERVFYIYRNNGKKGIQSDQVEFKFKAGAGKAWGRMMAHITISEPRSHLFVGNNELDFGKVFIGQSHSLPILIRNDGGGVAKGVIKMGAPLSVVDSPEFELSEGKQRNFEVFFSPTEPGEFEGRIEFQSGSKPYPFVKTIGRGAYRFHVLDTVIYNKKNGSDFIEISNSCPEDLTLSVSAPSPLICQSSVFVPAGSSRKLNLSLKEGAYTEKKVEIAIHDGEAIRRVRVDLPPSPVLLEWDNGPLLDAGRIPFRNNMPLRIGLRNAGLNDALVILEAQGGVELGPSQASEFDLEAEGKVFVDVVWKLPEEEGEAQAKLTAVNDGLKSVLQLKAIVEAPKLTVVTGPSPSQEAIANKKTADTSNPYTPVDEADQRRLKQEPARVEPGARQHLFSTDLLLFWSYSGPEPVEFVVEIYGIQRPVGLLNNPLEKHLEIPGKSPVKPLNCWLPMPISELTRDKARWEAVIPAMPPPGFHRMRLGSRPHGESEFQYCEFPLGIPEPKPFWSGRFFLLSILIFCSGYLLTKKIHAMRRRSHLST